MIEEPVTLAVNCCLPPTATFAELGVMLTASFPAIVTVTEPDLVESATEVAMTKTIEGVGSVEGAV
jgi:GTPase